MLFPDFIVRHLLQRALVSWGETDLAAPERWGPEVKTPIPSSPQQLRRPPRTPASSQGAALTGIEPSGTRIVFITTPPPAVPEVEKPLFRALHGMLVTQCCGLLGLDAGDVTVSLTQLAGDRAPVMLLCLGGHPGVPILASTAPLTDAPPASGELTGAAGGERQSKGAPEANPPAPRFCEGCSLPPSTSLCGCAAGMEAAAALSCFLMFGLRRWHPGGHCVPS